MNRTEAARAIALAKYARKDQLDIDDSNCPVEPVPSGMWVQAWVYVPNAEIDELVSYDAEA